MISRDWQCLNRKCGNVFHSYERDNPPCPVCGCVRVGWVPGGGHIGNVAPRMDARLRSIADQHGLTDLNSVSHSRVNRAAPRVYQHPVDPSLGVHHWGLGVATGIPRTGVACVEASNPINLTGKVAVGPNAAPHSVSGTVPGPVANTVLAGRTTRRSVT